MDGIIAGEGSGPLVPRPVCSGIVLGGTNPAAVDAVAAALMGFDPECLPVVANAFHGEAYGIGRGRWQDLEVISNCASWNRSLGRIQAGDSFHFEPHFGWKGHVERHSVR